VLLVIVMVVNPVPPPVQTPLVVIATVKPELDVAATLKVAPLIAEAGAGTVIVMTWLAFKELDDSVTCGAAL
jgi:hypothetical protein